MEFSTARMLIDLESVSTKSGSGKMDEKTTIRDSVLGPRT